jgi:adenine-specific DNA-methyltransferase
VEADDRPVTVSFSAGLGDLDAPEQRQTPLSEILDKASNNQLLHIPITASDDAAVQVVRGWPGSLHTYGMQISTGPVVAFRAAHLLAPSGDVPAVHAPLLWMQNVRAMRIEWPVRLRDKAQYIRLDPAAAPLLVPDQNYVILRRFSAKEQERRLTAAPLLAGQLGAPHIGLENHLNYIYRPGGSLTEDEAFGLAALLNSALLDRYFRTFNGNTQVSATELRAMPLPPLATIAELGRRVRAVPDDIEQIDEGVRKILNSSGRGLAALWRDNEPD